jgi:hypothetical protein
VVLDDVEHAEEPGDGLDFCEALLEGAVGRRPALVLATIAQESLDASPALLDRVKAMQELGALRLDLPALTPEQIRGLLDEALTLDEALAPGGDKTGGDVPPRRGHVVAPGRRPRAAEGPMSSFITASSPASRSTTSCP